MKIKSSYQQLGDRAIHPNACMNFSQSQIAIAKTGMPVVKSVIQRVPEPFDQTNAIQWTPVWSLTQQEFLASLRLLTVTLAIPNQKNLTVGQILTGVQRVTP